eukprot:GHVH01017048.1.p1 GENE.GHVH01017048.1~~GHVH01017048.1.p1  ORF type:complete len:1913 (+),score=233.37 GHVH01017048.1:216-5741(+)
MAASESMSNSLFSDSDPDDTTFTTGKVSNGSLNVYTTMKSRQSNKTNATLHSDQHVGLLPPKKTIHLPKNYSVDDMNMSVSARSSSKGPSIVKPPHMKQLLRYTVPPKNTVVVAPSEKNESLDYGRKHSVSLATHQSLSRSPASTGTKSRQSLATRSGSRHPYKKKEITSSFRTAIASTRYGFSVSGTNLPIKRFPLKFRNHVHDLNYEPTYRNVIMQRYPLFCCCLLIVVICLILRFPLFTNDELDIGYIVARFTDPSCSKGFVFGNDFSESFNELLFKRTSPCSSSGFPLVDELSIVDWHIFTFATITSPAYSIIYFALTVTPIFLVFFFFSKAIDRMICVWIAVIMAVRTVEFSEHELELDTSLLTGCYTTINSSENFLQCYRHGDLTDLATTSSGDDEENYSDFCKTDNNSFYHARGPTTNCSLCAIIMVEMAYYRTQVELNKFDQTNVTDWSVEELFCKEVSEKSVLERNVTLPDAPRNNDSGYLADYSPTSWKDYLDWMDATNDDIPQDKMVLSGLKRDAVINRMIDSADIDGRDLNNGVGSGWFYLIEQIIFLILVGCVASVNTATSLWVYTVTAIEQVSLVFSDILWYHALFVKWDTRFLSALPHAIVRALIIFVTFYSSMIQDYDCRMQFYIVDSRRMPDDHDIKISKEANDSSSDMGVSASDGISEPKKRFKWFRRRPKYRRLEVIVRKASSSVADFHRSGSVHSNVDDKLIYEQSTGERDRKARILSNSKTNDNSTSIADPTSSDQSSGGDEKRKFNEAAIMYLRRETKALLHRINEFSEISPEREWGDSVIDLKDYVKAIKEKTETCIDVLRLTEKDNGENGLSNEGYMDEIIRSYPSEASRRLRNLAVIQDGNDIEVVESKDHYNENNPLITPVIGDLIGGAGMASKVSNRIDELHELQRFPLGGKMLLRLIYKHVQRCKRIPLDVDHPMAIDLLPNPSRPTFHPLIALGWQILGSLIFCSSYQEPYTDAYRKLLSDALIQAKTKGTDVGRDIITASPLIQSVDPEKLRSSVSSSHHLSSVSHKSSYFLESRRGISNNVKGKSGRRAQKDICISGISLFKCCTPDHFNSHTDVRADADNNSVDTNSMECRHSDSADPLTLKCGRDMFYKDLEFMDSWDDHMGRTRMNRSSSSRDVLAGVENEVVLSCPPSPVITPHSSADDASRSQMVQPTQDSTKIKDSFHRCQSIVNQNNIVPSSLLINVSKQHENFSNSGMSNKFLESPRKLVSVYKTTKDTKPDTAVVLDELCIVRMEKACLRSVSLTKKNDENTPHSYGDLSHCHCNLKFARFLYSINQCYVDCLSIDTYTNDARAASALFQYAFILKKLEIHLFIPSSIELFTILLTAATHGIGYRDGYSVPPKESKNRAKDVIKRQKIEDLYAGLPVAGTLNGFLVIRFLSTYLDTILVERISTLEEWQTVKQQMIQLLLSLDPERHQLLTDQLIKATDVNGEETFKLSNREQRMMVLQSTLKVATHAHISGDNSSHLFWAQRQIREAIADASSAGEDFGDSYSISSSLMISSTNSFASEVCLEEYNFISLVIEPVLFALVRRFPSSLSGLLSNSREKVLMWLLKIQNDSSLKSKLPSEDYRDRKKLVPIDNGLLHLVKRSESRCSQDGRRSGETPSLCSRRRSNRLATSENPSDFRFDGKSRFGSVTGSKLTICSTSSRPHQRTPRQVRRLRRRSMDNGLETVSVHTHSMIHNTLMINTSDDSMKSYVSESLSSEMYEAKTIQSYFQRTDDKRASSSSIIFKSDDARSSLGQSYNDEFLGLVQSFNRSSSATSDQNDSPDQEIVGREAGSSSSDLLSDGDIGSSHEDFFNFKSPCESLSR